MMRMLRVRRAGRGRSVIRACLALVPLIMLAAPEPTWAQPLFTLNPGAVGGDNYSVISYGPPANAVPAFGAGNNVLVSPGAGYGTLIAPVGGVQTDFGGVNAPAGPLAAGINTFGSTPPAGNAANPFGPGFVGYNANNGGIHWNTWGQSDTTIGDNNFSVSNSRGIATYSVNGALTGGQGGITLPVQGFLPPGSQAFAALSGTFTLTAPGGAVIQKVQDAVVISVENQGTGLPNGVQNVNIPIAGGVAQGVAANSRTGYAQVFDIFGDLYFEAFGIAMVPGVNYVRGDTLTLDGTLTLAVDPMASITYDPGILPLDAPIPIIGIDALGVPEPSTFVLGGLSLVIGLGYGVRRPRRNVG